MQLVGASNWFIKRPFIWHGIVLGFFSGVMNSVNNALDENAKKSIVHKMAVKVLKHGGKMAYNAMKKRFEEGNSGGSFPELDVDKHMDSHLLGKDGSGEQHIDKVMGAGFLSKFEDLNDAEKVKGPLSFLNKMAGKILLKGARMVHSHMKKELARRRAEGGSMVGGGHGGLHGGGHGGFHGMGYGDLSGGGINGRHGIETLTINSKERKNYQGEPKYKSVNTYQNQTEFRPSNTHINF